jgi:hypothetical protein
MAMKANHRMRKALDVAKTVGVAVVLEGLAELRKAIPEKLNQHGYTMKDTRKALDKAGKVMRKKGDRLLTYTSREVIAPAEKRVRRAWRDLTAPKRRMPTWAKVTLTGIGTGAVVYGLAKSERVRQFAEPMSRPIRELMDV